MLDDTDKLIKEFLLNETQIDSLGSFDFEIDEDDMTEVRQTMKKLLTDDGKLSLICIMGFFSYFIYDFIYLNSVSNKGYSYAVCK